MKHAYKLYIGATVALGIAAVVLTVAAKMQKPSKEPFQLLKVDGREVITAELSESEYIYLFEPKLACSNRSEGIYSMSALAHFTTKPYDKVETALWSKHNTEEPSGMPSYAAGYAREMCSWYKS